MDFAAWTAAICNESPAFASSAGRLATEAHRDRRASLRFADADLDELRDQLARASEVPRAERRYSWSDDRAYKQTRSGAPEVSYPCEALRRYIAGCEVTAGHYLRATAAATVIHECARATAPVVIEPATTAGEPAPSGPVASMAAAGLTGVDHGTPAARRDALYRVSPPDRRRIGFSVVLRQTTASR